MKPKSRWRYCRLATVALLMLLVGTGVLTGGAVADDADFAVEITEVNGDAVDHEDGLTVDEGGDLTVVAEISNDGSSADTQEIVLESTDRERQDSDVVTLDAGDQTTVELSWATVPERPERDISPVVKSTNDADSVGVTVLWSEFTVDSLHSEPTEVRGGETVTFEARILNIGTDSDIQDIELRNHEGTVVGTVSDEELAGTESTTQTFTVTAPTDPGRYDYRVSTDDVTVAEPLTVLSPASFDVSIVDTAVSGTTLSVDAVVENNGDLEDTQPVEFSVNGSVADTTDVTLAGGESTDVSFSYDTGTDTFEKDIEIKTQQPAVATERITKGIVDGPTIESISPSVVQGAEELTVGYTATGADVETVSLQITDPNGDTFVDRSGTAIEYEVAQGIEQTESIAVPPRERLAEGDYEVTISVDDRFGGTDSVTSQFSVDTVFNEGDVTSQDVYRTPAGDFVEISLDIEDNLDEVYLLVSGDAETGQRNLQNYVDVLHIEPTDDDLSEARFVINTRLVGTNVAPREVYFPVGETEQKDINVRSYAHDIGADTKPTDLQPDNPFYDVSFRDHRGNEIAGSLAEFRTDLDLHSRGSPLQADRYRLVVGGNGEVLIRDDGIPDLKQAVERTNIDLTQPTIEGVNTYVLPPGPANKLDRFDDTDVESIDEDEFLETDDLGVLLEQATERETVTRGDRLLVEVQATGMYGALMAHQPSQSDRLVHPTSPNNHFDRYVNHPALNADVEPGANDGERRSGIENARFAELLDNHEGVHLELSDSALGGPNRPGSTLLFRDTDESDLYVLPDDSTDQWESDRAVGDSPQIGGLYFVVDTRESAPFDRQPRDGDELMFEIAYESPDGERYTYDDYSLADGEKPAPFDPPLTEIDGFEHFPYFGSSDTTISANSTIGFHEPYVEYDRTVPGGELVVPIEENGTVSGSTNIAPGSDVTLQLIASNRPDPELITVDDIEVDEDGRFNTTADFSAIQPGERIEVEFYTPGRTVDSRVIDKRGAYVVEDLDNPAIFEITNHTESAEVMRGHRLGDIEATITNTGDIPDNQQVRFEIDGEGVKEETVRLESGETETLDLSDNFVVLSPGEYSYTIQTDDDQQTGQLTVTEADDETADQLDTVDTENGTVETPPDETDGDGPDDESGPEGLFGLVGIQSRDIAVAAAVTGAMHVLGQWT